MSTTHTSHRTWLGFSPVSWVWAVGFWSGAAYEFAYFKFGFGWALLVGLVLSLFVGSPLLVAAFRATGRGQR